MDADRPSRRRARIKNCDTCKLLIITVYLFLSIFQSSVASNLSSNFSSGRHWKTRRELSASGGLNVVDNDFETSEMRPNEPIIGDENDEKTTTTIMNIEILPESEALVRDDDNGSRTVSKNDDDLERLVRLQVDSAAADWASLGTSLDHGSNLDEHIEQLRQLQSGYREGKLLAREESRSKSDKHKHFYPNHNYQFDQESSEPFRESMSAAKMNTDDPMTTSSSDGSSGYTSHSRPTHMYRWRSPIAPSSSSTSGPDARPVKLWPPTSTTTLAPKIMLALQRLDQHRNRTAQNMHGQTTELIGASQRATSSVSSSDRVNLYSQAHQRPHGFVDEPTLTVIANGQQPPEAVSFADIQTSRGSQTQHQQSKDELRKPSVAPALFSLQHLTDSIRTSRKPDLNGEINRDNNSSMDFIGLVKEENQRTTTRVSPQDQASNLNGNLAARLSANRYKKTGARQTTTRATTREYERDYGDGETGRPLIVNMRARPTEPNSTPAMQPSTSPAELDDLASTTHSWPAQPAATTVSSLQKAASTKRPWRQTTIPLSSATSNANLSPDNLNEELADLIKSAAQHHHLHSHVHSIKPAVISIPIQHHHHQQIAAAAADTTSGAQSKLSPYDGIVAAAAAAAAAAATASARARAPPSKQSGVDLSAYPQVKASLRPLKHGSLVPVKRYNLRSIPIGGTLASTLQQQQQQQQQQPQQYQSSHILASLLDTANRALRQVTGGRRGPINVLQAASSNQATPVHSDPNNHLVRLLPLANLNQRAIQLPNQKQQQQQHLLLTNPFLAAAAEAAENLAELSADSSPLESVGLFQAPIDSAGSPMDAHLASLIPPAEQQTMRLLGNQSLTSSPFASSLEAWSSEQASPAANSSEPGDVVFASLGDHSNLLFPISALGSLALGSEQNSDTITMHSDPGMLLDEHIHFGSQPSSVSDLLESQLWNSVDMQNFSSDASGRQPSKTIGEPASAHKKGKLVMKKVVKSKSKSKRPPKGLDYALNHYIDADKSNHQGPSSLGATIQLRPAQQQQQASDGSKAGKFSQPLVAWSAPGQTDAFRPIIHPHYYTTYLGNNFHTDERGVGNPAPRPARKPRGQGHQSQAPAESNINNNSNRGSASSVSDASEPTRVTSSSSSSSGGLVWPDSWPFDHHSAMHHHYPLLSQAGSSNRPHVAALPSDLANLHRLHHLLQSNSMRLQQHHDLATSETARLTVGSPIGRTAMLLHFWPLALALLPVMIIVAIVAQLIMAAPLVLFAFATVAVARLLGPNSSRELDTILQANRRQDRRGSHRRSSDGLALGSNVTMPLEEDYLSSANSNGTQTKRTRREAADDDDDDGNMDEYIESLIFKFATTATTTTSSG